MRVWALGLLLILLILIQSGPVVQPLDDFQADNKQVAQIYKDTCRLTKYECTNVETPLVRRSLQLQRMGIRGLYLGGRVLWINAELLPTQAKLTTFHEIVHYLQVQAGGLDPRFASRLAGCVVEREAMEFTNQYADEIGIPILKRDLKEWYQRYKC